MMSQISAGQLDAYRQNTFRLRADLRLGNVNEALEFVQARGFVYFWPIKGIIMPSLWTAVAGNRPVADAHDDPGHVTWGWKDQMLDQRKWYYAKILRGKAMMIALDVAPYFYALSENYGDPDEDYLHQYQDGLLSREEKLIYEALMRHGPLNTVALRRRTQMSGKAGKSPFDRALTALQRDFKILPVAVAQAGAWRYSFVYDLVHRYYPELPELARPIGLREAREKLMTLYFTSVGAATAAEARKLFQWRPADVNKTLERLVEEGHIAGGYQVESFKGNYFALPPLSL